MKLRFKKRISSILLLIFLLTTITGSASADSGSDITVPIYHQHTGNSSSVGGCYAEKTGTTTTSYEGYWTTTTQGTWTCFNCHTTQPCTLENWSCGCGGSGTHYINSACPNCGASSQGGSYPHSTHSVTTNYNYIDLNCGLSTSSEVATLNCHKSTEEWTTTLDLTASYTILNPSCIPSSDPFLWNGTLTSSNTLSISYNGTYSLQLNANDTSNTSASIINVPITNIDHYSPSFSLSANQSLFTLSTNILVENPIDLQPDLSAGCGLNGTAYSYDNGITWSSDPYVSVSDNGTYTVIVRDNLENQDSKTILITNIDKEPPTISVNSIAPSGWTNGNVTVTVSASDNSCGLHEFPYSYDNGGTWISEPFFTAFDNGNYTVLVRDALGNQNSVSLTISNIDRVQPNLLLTYSPDLEQWFDGELQVTLDAEDVNSGLHDYAFSMDGMNWVNTSTFSITDDGTYTFYVKDKANNVYSITKTLGKKIKLLSLIETILPPTQTSERVKTVSSSVVEEEPEIVTDTSVPKITEPAQITKPITIIDEEIPRSDNLLKKIMVGLGATSSSGGIIFFLFFYVSRKTKIFSIDENGAIKCIGKAKITKKKDKIFYLYIPKRLKRQATSSIMKCYIDKNLLKKNTGQMLIVKVGKEEFIHTLTNEIVLDLSMA